MIAGVLAGIRTCESPEYKSELLRVFQENLWISIVSAVYVVYTTCRLLKVDRIEM